MDTTPRVLLTVPTIQSREGAVRRFAPPLHAPRRVLVHRCAACVELSGQSTSVQPHAALHIESTAIRCEGQFHEYKCRACGARWHRVLAKAGSGMEPQRWRMAARTESHV